MLEIGPIGAAPSRTRDPRADHGAETRRRAAAVGGLTYDLLTSDKK